MKKLLIALLTVATLSAGEIVSWLPNPPEDFVTHYNVYAANHPNAPKPWALLTSTTNLSITNSASGKAAYYVTAVNVSGESEPSNVAVQKPGKPQGERVDKQ